MEKDTDCVLLLAAHHGRYLGIPLATPSNGLELRKLDTRIDLIRSATTKCGGGKFHVFKVLRISAWVSMLPQQNILLVLVLRF